MPSDLKTPADREDADELIGRTLGDYVVLRHIGTGAMADVYLARQASLDRPVALKVLRPSLAKDAAYLQRFRSEARAAAGLVHANIVNIFEVGEIDGLHFIAQEFVPGATLGQILERDGPLSSALVVRVAAQVAAALARASESGVVHRDIKPDNVMFSTSGDVKVTDFGLARDFSRQSDLTQIGMTMGTPLYMSPEQVEGGRLDSRSDLYSLGATAYHLLSGAPPFTSETALGVAVKHLREPHRPTAQAAPNAEPELCEIVDRLLAKSPDERFKSPNELIAALNRLRWAWDESGADASWTQLRSTVAATVPRFNLAATRQLQTVINNQRKRPRWAVLAVLLVAAAIAGAAWGFWADRSKFLAELNSATVEKQSDAWAQLLYAKFHDQPSAWRAVKEYFPQAETAGYVALLGLGDFYLRYDDYRPAYSAFSELATATDRSYHNLGAAMCYVVRARQGDSASLTPLDAQEESELEQDYPARFAEYVEAKRAAYSPSAANAPGPAN